jgi:hypothetical protein
MFNKEDILTNDVEHLESTNVENLCDTPIEVYTLCFPNDKNPIKSLTRIYRDVFASYLSKKNKLSISEIEDIVTTSKRGVNKLEMDVYVKTVIEGDFQAMLHAETDLSMEIIYSSSISEIRDKAKMADKLTIVKKQPEDLSDYTLYSNKRITGRIV